jgi:addiction module HigA family antidote
MTKLMTPVHPGEILKEEFMRPLSLSANALARAVRVPPNRISAIVNGERGLTADIRHYASPRRSEPPLNSG